VGLTWWLRNKGPSLGHFNPCILVPQIKLPQEASRHAGPRSASRRVAYTQARLRFQHTSPGNAQNKTTPPRPGPEDLKGREAPGRRLDPNPSGNALGGSGFYLLRSLGLTGCSAGIARLAGPQAQRRGPSLLRYARRTRGSRAHGSRAHVGCGRSGRDHLATARGESALRAGESASRGPQMPFYRPWRPSSRAHWETEGLMSA
jgi:hypothetical protein